MLCLDLEKVTKTFLLKVKTLMAAFESDSISLLFCVLFSTCFGFMYEECAGAFHKGGARLILCGKNWEKLEELADDLANADPTVVSLAALKQY